VITLRVLVLDELAEGRAQVALVQRDHWYGSDEKPRKPKTIIAMLDGSPPIRRPVAS
jgi:hypothetical protein